MPREDDTPLTVRERVLLQTALVPAFTRRLQAQTAQLEAYAQVCPVPVALATLVTGRAEKSTAP